MEGGENGGGGEGTTGQNSQNKDDTVDDEEGIHSICKSTDGDQSLLLNVEEKNEAGTIKIVGNTEHETLLVSKDSEINRDSSTRQMQECLPSKDLTQSKNEIGRMNEVNSVEKTMTTETGNAERMESSESVSSDTGTSHHNKAASTSATSSIQNTSSSNQPHNSNQSSSSASVKDANHETEKLPKTHVDEAATAHKAENKSKQTGAIEKDAIKLKDRESKSPVKQKLEIQDKGNNTIGSIQETQTPSRPPNVKEQSTTSRKSLNQKEQPITKSKGEKETVRTQEKKSEAASSSTVTIKTSSPKANAKNKITMKATLKADVENKPTKSKSMELNKTEKENNEKSNQKQTKGSTSTALTSGLRVRSPGRNLLETSKQKSASTGTLSKTTDSQKKQQEAQPLATQEKSVKLKKGHDTKAAVSKSPIRKSSKERLVNKDVQSSADKVADKVIQSTFQGTISRPLKCDEKLQRTTTTESKKNQERINKVTAEISATTEAAIKEQFKQLESKIPHELSVQSQHTVPKQKPKSPTRKQPQQKQQKPATQQKIQDQKQTLQRQQSPQKQQKPPRSPTRKQQEQKQLQQKPPSKQQTQPKQLQAEKELSQPKQQVPQVQTTNLSKQEKQQIERKQSLQQEQVPSLSKQQLANKPQQQVPVIKHKTQVKQRKQDEQDNMQQQYEELQQQEKKHEEQKLLHLKELEDQEQKEVCEQPMQQQDKQTIEQQNHQKKQKELGLAHTKQHEELGKEKQHKEEQPEQQESKEHPKQQQQQQSEDGDDDSGRGCGMQGRTCPIYFGVKSYLHHFYDSTPVKNSHLYEEYIEEDDFEYAVDPIKGRGCRRCCRGFWFRAGLWGGINLILVGVITLLVGYLTPQREMIVGHHNNLEILDRSAIAFNRRLELCRLAGLAVFCCGGLVLLLTLLLSTFLHVGSHNNNNTPCCGDNAYYGYVATSLVEPFIANPNQTVPVSTGIKIPITEQIKSVQPTLWPDIATVKDGTLVPHMP